MILLQFHSETSEYVTFLDLDEISEIEAIEYARPGFTLTGAWTIEPRRIRYSRNSNFLPGDGDVYLRD